MTRGNCRMVRHGLERDAGLVSKHTNLRRNNFNTQCRDTAERFMNSTGEVGALFFGARIIRRRGIGFREGCGAEPAEAGFPVQGDQRVAIGQEGQPAQRCLD